MLKVLCFAVKTRLFDILKVCFPATLCGLKKGRGKYLESVNLSIKE